MKGLLALLGWQPTDSTIVHGRKKGRRKGGGRGGGKGGGGVVVPGRSCDTFLSSASKQWYRKRGGE